MKKTNKGFSMVELIIVIAIMAILAGALAPALIKYINRSRLSSDIQTGQTIAKAIQTALADEDAFEDAANISSPTDPSSVFTGDMLSAVQEGCGGTIPTKGKAKKDLDGSQLSSTNFLVTLDLSTSSCQVWYNDTDHMVYPTVSANMSK